MANILYPSLFLLTGGAMIYDFIVIGSGIIGMSTAWQLRQMRDISHISSSL